MSSSTTTNTTDQTVNDINTLSAFLSNSQLTSLELPITTTTYTNNQTPSPIPTTHPTIAPTTLILAPSAILHQAHTIFSHLLSSLSTPSSIQTLVLTGGIGHSTPHLYTAILASPRYHTLPSLIGRAATDLSGLAEARLWYLIFVHFYDGERVTREWDCGRGLRVLVEEESTNCGANAALSRRILEGEGISLGSVGGGEDVVIVQDPTMSLRTKASFEKVYLREVLSGAVRFWCWPTFVPAVTSVDGSVVWDVKAVGMEGVDGKGLWDMKRFYGLILGEVVRLRDDEAGYGPNGKGFIVHVDVPDNVERAWDRLNRTLEFQR